MFRLNYLSTACCYSRDGFYRLKELGDAGGDIFIDIRTLRQYFMRV